MICLICWSKCLARSRRGNRQEGDCRPRQRKLVVLVASAVVALAVTPGFSAAADEGDNLSLSIRLEVAAETDDLATVRAVVSRRDWLDCSGALEIAAEHGHLDIVQYLVEHCRDVGDLEQTVERAVDGGHLEVVRYLAHHVVDLPENSSADQLRRVMISAAERGNLAMVKILGDFPEHAAANAGKGPDKFSCSIATNAAAREGHLAIVRYLVEHCREIDDLDEAFASAVLGDDWEEIRYLFGHHVSKDALQGAMRVAIEKSWDDLFRLLLPAVDLDKALGKAVREGRLVMVKAIVEQGAHDLTGALCQAAEQRDLEVMRYLVGQGASVDGACDSDEPTAKSSGGRTPLACALRNHDDVKRTAAASFLLDKGARAESLCFDDLEGFLNRGGDLDMLKRLAANGADLHVCNEQGEGLLGLTHDPAMRAFLQSQGLSTSWDEHWLHVRRHVGGWSSAHPALLVAVIGLVYLGLAVYWREGKYRGRPMANGFGTVNGMLSTGAAGALALGLVGALVAALTFHPHGDSYSAAAAGVGTVELGALIGGVVGAAAGIPLGHFCRDLFRRNSLAYYSLPVAAVLVPLIWAAS